MLRTLKVHFLPTLVPSNGLQDKTVVVIDVLRASTTIIHALAAGASEVIPCVAIEDARRASELEPTTLLGGERSGRKIDGFDFGNSPSEYTRDQVLGKRIAFTTTNGTRAMLACRAAGRVLIGAFANLSAICNELQMAEEVALVCAGTDGQITSEDVLFAGAVISDLCGRSDTTVVGNDEARLAVTAWNATCSELSGDRLQNVLRETLGGNNLVTIGHGTDIEVAAKIDSHRVAPELCLQDWRIHLP